MCEMDHVEVAGDVEDEVIQGKCIEAYELVDGIVIEDGVQHIDIKVEEESAVEVDIEEEYEYDIEVDPCNMDYHDIATNEINGDSCQVSMDEVDTVDEMAEQEMMSDDNFAVKTECDIERAEAPCEFFMVATVEEMRELINDYSERTSSHFVAWCKTKHFGIPSLECDLSGHRIQWHDDRSVNNFIQYDGIPHVTIGHYELHCQFGVDKSAAQKEKRRKMKEEGEIIVKSRILKTPTKKCGCPAKIVVKHIIRFPEYMIDKDTKWKRNEASSKLKAKLKDSRGEVVTEAIILGRLPDISEHKFHENLHGKEFAKEVVSRELAVKAQEYFLQNKSNTEIIDSLREYVVNEMFWNQDPPDFKRRKFFPTRKDIRNFNARVRHLSRFSTEELERVRKIIEQCQVKDNNGNISFQIEEKCMNEDNDKPESSDEELTEPDSIEVKGKKKKEERKVHSFVFCHQSSQQQRLIKRYSSISYLVEIETILTPKRILTYRMYAIVVQTNVDFQVVGVIIVSKQRKDGLVEGLTLFREWNSTWNPKYLLVDFSDTIFDAVLRVFPESNYFLNPTSCESKWLEFVGMPSNNTQEYSDEILTYLKNMQYSLTEDSLSIAAALLERSEVWQKGDKLRSWFQKSWLHLAKKWVFGYRSDDLIIMQHLKLSINDCIYVYKDALYQSAKLNGFIELLESLTLNTCDTEYAKYVQRNNEHYIYYTQFKKDNGFSESMQGIPISMIPYVEGICKHAEANCFSIVQNQFGTFTVRYDNSALNTNTPENSSENTLASDTNINQILMGESPELSTHQDMANDKQVGVVCLSGHQIHDNSATQLVMSQADTHTFIQDDPKLIISCSDDDQDIVNVDNVHSNSSSVLDNELLNCDIPTTVVLSAMKEDENLNGNINNLNVSPIELVNNETEVEIKETEFGWIEYSNKICTGEYTVSFGHSHSHPFCTCSHWLLYRLPCIHMFAVFCKIPGWRYDMLGLQYRLSPVLDIDYSCINYPINPPQLNVNSQTSSLNMTSVKTQTHFIEDENIFETLINVKGQAMDQLLEQTRNFLQYINKVTFLFKDKLLHQRLCLQLKDLVDNLVIKSRKKDNGIVFGELAQALKPILPKENGKPLKISSLNLEQISKARGKSRPCKIELQDLPKIIPMASSDNLTVSMIELPSNQNLESVLQALTRNNPSLKVISAQRVIKPINTKSIEVPLNTNTWTNSLINDCTVKMPPKIVIKNIAPNADACEKPVVFRILPNGPFNNGSSLCETTVEVDVNKAMPIHVENTTVDVPTEVHNTSLEGFISPNRNHDFSPISVNVHLPEKNGQKNNICINSLIELTKPSDICCENPLSDNPDENLTRLTKPSNICSENPLSNNLDICLIELTEPSDICSIHPDENLTRLTKPSNICSENPLSNNPNKSLTELTVPSDICSENPLSHNHDNSLAELTKTSDICSEKDPLSNNPNVNQVVVNKLNSVDKLNLVESCVLDSMSHLYEKPDLVILNEELDISSKKRNFNEVSCLTDCSEPSTCKVIKLEDGALQSLTSVDTDICNSQIDLLPDKPDIGNKMLEI